MQTSRRAARADVVALVSTIATVLLMLMFLASPASAQMRVGKLKTAMANSLPSAVTPATGGVKTGSVTFDERVLEITAERLDQFMAGLDGEVETAARVNAQDLDAIDRANAAADAAYEKEMASYEAKAQEHDKCTSAISGDLEKQMKPGMPTEQDRAGMEAVARAGTECGVQPTRPTVPARKSALTWSDVSSAGARASRMRPGQYAIFREWVAPYVLLNGRSSDMMYTSPEAGALKSKLESLAKYGSALKNN